MNPDSVLTDLSKDAVAKWLPNLAKFPWELSKDLQNRRWLVKCKIRGSCSRSVDLYTEHRAALMVLKFAWHQHVEFGGEACPYKVLEDVDWQT